LQQLAGGTVPGTLTVAGLLTTQAGVFNSGGTVTSSGSNFVGTALAGVSVTGNVQVTAAGDGLKVNEGANGKQGTAVLVAGTVTVANTNITANSRIFLTSNLDGGTPGFVRVSAKTASTSFVITSSSGTDTSTIAYEIFEPG